MDSGGFLQRLRHARRLDVGRLVSSSDGWCMILIYLVHRTPIKMAQ